MQRRVSPWRHLLGLGVWRWGRCCLVVAVGQRVSVRVRVQAAARRYLAGECVQGVQHGGRRPHTANCPGHGGDAAPCADARPADALSADKRRGGIPAPRLIATSHRKPHTYKHTYKHAHTSHFFTNVYSSRSRFGSASCPIWACSHILFYFIYYHF